MARPKPKPKKQKPSDRPKAKKHRDKALMRFKRQGDTPDWKVTDLGGNKLGIECPREKCKGKATVNKKRWLYEQTDFLSRPCTYCNWLAMIPINILPKRDPRR